MTTPNTPANPALNTPVDPTQALGHSSQLTDGGKPILFTLPNGQSAMVIRWQGQVHGWINECQHASVPMDFDGDVFESGRQYLMCPYHGAIYQPGTGLCVGGPCRGARLDAVDVVEKDGAIWLQAPAA